MSKFTCITCRVAFYDLEIQRLHYKCDWHRYNLIRRVFEYPTVNSEEYQRRVIQQRIKDQQHSRDKSVYCKVCRKNFSNEKAYGNHLNSKKHKDNEKLVDETDIEETIDKNEEPSEKTDSNVKIENEDLFVVADVEEVDSDEWDEDVENPIDRNNCLFCSHHSATLLKNVKHMSLAHSFFVPDIDYCVNLKGLLSYLGEKITQGRYMLKS